METSTTGRWITLKEAAAHLNVSPSYLYQKGDSVGIPRYRIGQFYRYNTLELDAWVRTQGRE